MDAGQADEVEQQAEVERQALRHRHFTVMDVVDRIAELLFDRLLRIVSAKLPIFVDRARDQAEVQALRLFWFAIDVECKAGLASVAQPFLEAEAVALRLGDLL